jgi:hypothetical protein
MDIVYEDKIHIVDLKEVDNHTLDDSCKCGFIKFPLTMNKETRLIIIHKCENPMDNISEQSILNKLTNDN